MLTFVMRMREQHCGDTRMEHLGWFLGSAGGQRRKRFLNSFADFSPLEKAVTIRFA
jgi:hypothetical protein